MGHEDKIVVCLDLWKFFFTLIENKVIDILLRITNVYCIPDCFVLRLLEA